MGGRCPGLARDGYGAIALWRPVVQGPDVVAMNSLIAAMPPVCRAEQGEHDAHELASSALHAMLDAAMRAALPPGTATPRPAATSTNSPDTGVTGWCWTGRRR